MPAPQVNTGADELHALLDDLARQLQLLPKAQRTGAEADIDRIRSLVGGSTPEPQFTSIFRSSPVAQVILRALDRAIIAANDAFLEQIGYTQAELLGRTALELGLFFNPADRERLALSGANGALRNQEIKLRAKNGAAITYLISLEPLELNGEACLLITGIDISSRVQVEEALNERNRALEQAQGQLAAERSRLLAVMESMPVALAILDHNGGRIMENVAFESVWGRPVPQARTVDDYALYKAWWAETGQLVRPEEWASWRVVQENRPVTGQFMEIERFDGSRAFIINSGAPFYDAEGRVAGCAVVIMDITERVRAERALRESERVLQEANDRFRVAISSLQMTVFRMDRDLRYIWIYNPTLGLTSEQFIGRRDDELNPGINSAELIAIKQSVIDNGKSAQKEIRIVLNGETRYFLLSLEPTCDMDGQVSGLIGAALDVTEQRRIETERLEALTQSTIQRQLLNNREQERQSIARDLHDGPIQTLSSTMFHLQMVKELFPDPSLHEELDKIGLNVKDAIRDLRETMTELRPPALMQFGFAKVVRLYMEDFHTRFPEIQVEMDIAENDRAVSGTVLMTLFRIFQAAINNILHHSGASRAWMVYRIENGCFHFELRDNGRGFRPNGDLTSLTQDGHFGLAGMKERAESINARFAVVSAPAKGTTITVTGPVDGMKK